MRSRRPRPRPVAFVGPTLLATAAVALALLPITSPRTSPVCPGLLRGAHGLRCAAEAIPGNANRGLRGGCTEQCAAPTLDGVRWSGLRLWVRARVFVRGARWCPAGSRRCGNPHLRRNPCRSGGEWATVLEQRRRELLEGGPARDLLDFLGSVECTLRPHRATSAAASRPSESPGAGLTRHSSATGLASRAAASGDDSTESEARSSRPGPAAKLVFWGGGAARGARCRSAGLTGCTASARAVCATRRRRGGPWLGALPRGSIPRCAAATRRVRLVRGEGRDVSSQYGREGRGAGPQRFPLLALGSIALMHCANGATSVEVAPCERKPFEACSVSRHFMPLSPPDQLARCSGCRRPHAL